MKATIFFLAIVGLFVSCNERPSSKTTTSNKKITYEHFNIVYSLENQTLRFSLNTDLPDNIDISVTVSRSYWEKGNTSEYSIDYLFEQSKIVEWEKEHEVLIDNTKWKTDLAKKQKEMSQAGLGFDVDRISDSIEIYAVVPLSNDPYPQFNIKKTETGINVISTEVKIYLPIKGSISKESIYANYQSLKKNITYSISKNTPLMPEFEPSDPLAALDNVKDLKAGSRITVLSIKMKNNTPWYKVAATDPKGKSISNGWINSTALIGQEIIVIK